MNLNRFFKQTAVLWSGRTDDRYGKPSFANESQINCRWEDRQEKFVDANKRESLSRAVVFSENQILPGEYLWLGDLADVPNDNPLLIPAAHEVRATGAAPSVDAETTLRKAWL